MKTLEISFNQVTETAQLSFCSNIRSVSMLLSTYASNNVSNDAKIRKILENSIFTYSNFGTFNCEGIGNNFTYSSKEKLKLVYTSISKMMQDVINQIIIFHKLNEDKLTKEFIETLDKLFDAYE